MKILKSKIKGFTLVELLVVITLVGVLAGVLLVSLQGIRTSARDAQRKSDLETIKSALEMYKSSCGKYPASITQGGSLVSSGSPDEKCTAGITFLTTVPKDPIASKSYSYSLPSTTTRTSYALDAMTESGQIMRVTPLATTLFTPTVAPTVAPTSAPTATPTPCGTKTNGKPCSSNQECYSCWCNPSTYRCSVKPTL